MHVGRDNLDGNFANHFTGSVLLLVLAAIAVVFAIVSVFNIQVKTLGDMGNMTSTLPKFLFPDIPWNMEMVTIIFPYTFSLSIIGILESLLTAQLVDEMTETGILLSYLFLVLCKNSKTAKQ